MSEPEFQRLLDRAGLAGRNYTRAQFEGKLQTNYKFMGLGTFILFVVSVRVAATWLRGCHGECVQGPGRVGGGVAGTHAMSPSPKQRGVSRLGTSRAPCTSAGGPAGGCQVP